jgi:hypothetical protein
MSTMPLPSRRVLSALLARSPHGGLEAATPVERVLGHLHAALDAHEAALVALDHLEEALVAAHGLPRVPIPGTGRGAAPEHVYDHGTIDRRLGPGPEGRRLKAELRRRQNVFRQAATGAGLAAAQAREAAAARELAGAGSAVLAAPACAIADLSVKLAVLIASGESGPATSGAFPWWCLRVQQADTALLVNDVLPRRSP